MNKSEDEIRDLFNHLFDILKEGNIRKLDEAAKKYDGFPAGDDPLIGEPWIVLAIDCCPLETIKWILSRKVDLGFLENDGTTALSSAIRRTLPHRHKIMQMLIDHGAPLNIKGFNDYTPLHSAAMSNDVKALELLLKNGADPTIRTEIDDYATPYKEAKNFGMSKSVEFFESRGIK